MGLFINYIYKRFKVLKSLLGDLMEDQVLQNCILSNKCKMHETQGHRHYHVIYIYIYIYIYNKSVVPLRNILKYLQKCEGCTHLLWYTVYIYIYIYIYVRCIYFYLYIYIYIYMLDVYISTSNFKFSMCLFLFITSLIQIVAGIWIHTYFRLVLFSGGARGVMVIAIGNEHGETSSNPGPS